MNTYYLFAADLLCVCCLMWVERVLSLAVAVVSPPPVLVVVQAPEPATVLRSPPSPYPWYKRLP